MDAAPHAGVLDLARYVSEAGIAVRDVVGRAGDGQHAMPITEERVQYLKCRAAVGRVARWIIGERRRGQERRPCLVRNGCRASVVRRASYCRDGAPLPVVILRVPRRDDGIGTGGKQTYSKADIDKGQRRLLDVIRTMDGDTMAARAL